MSLHVTLYGVTCCWHVVSNFLAALYGSIIIDTIFYTIVLTHVLTFLILSRVATHVACSIFCSEHFHFMIARIVNLMNFTFKFLILCVWSVIAQCFVVKARSIVASVRHIHSIIAASFSINRPPC